MKSRSFFGASLVVFVLLAILSSTALAAKGGPGTSTGTGQVFFPNPVAYLQNQSLTDQKDANYPALQPAYVTVTLTNLDGSDRNISSGAGLEAARKSGFAQS